LPVLVGVLDIYIAVGRIERKRLLDLESWAFHHLLVAEQPVVSALRKHRCFFVARPVRKVEGEGNRHMISCGNLYQIARSQDLVVHTLQNEKSVNIGLDVSDRQGGGRQGSAQGQNLNRKAFQ